MFSHGRERKSWKEEEILIWESKGKGGKEEICFEVNHHAIMHLSIFICETLLRDLLQNPFTIYDKKKVIWNPY